MIDYEVAGGIATLRLSSPPLNAISFAMLDALRGGLRQANADPEVVAIILTGRSDHFSAGADLGIFREIRTRHDALRTSRIFQEAYQEIEDSVKPVVAVLAGRVMGGAVEMAAACHFRMSGAQTTFSMPEVTLGITPGAGGTQRLPRLMGPEAASRMLLSAEACNARQALAAGLIDVVYPYEESLDAVRRLIADAGELPRASRRDDKIGDEARVQAARRWAEEVAAGGPQEVIAPRKIAELVFVGIEQSFSAGIAAEREAFAQCMETLAARNKIYLFFATRQAGRVAELTDAPPRPIGKAAVVGMGTMGTGIAQALIQAGVPTVVRDESRASLEKGAARIRGSLQRRVDEGKLSSTQAEQTSSLLTTTESWEDLASADLVIESVFEDEAVKRAVVARLEEVCRPQAILASNTSTISLDVLARDVTRPDRLIGMHFFNPAQRMPLLEVIHHQTTSADTMSTTIAFARVIRKTPVLVRNREGFLVSRLFVPYLKEAFWLLEEGAEAAEIDRAAQQFGFPMGPLKLIDMAGLDILALSDRVLTGAFPRHGPLSQIAQRLVAEGQLGQKTGAGVYSYVQGDYTPRHSSTAERIIAEARQERGRTERRIDHEEIAQRLVFRMLAEASWVLQEGIARRAADLDVAIVLGIGFPDFRGGPWKHACDLGLGRVRQRLRELSGRLGDRFEPCPDWDRLEGGD